MKFCFCTHESANLSEFVIFALHRGAHRCLRQSYGGDGFLNLIIIYALYQRRFTKSAEFTNNACIFDAPRLKGKNRTISRAPRCPVPEFVFVLSNLSFEHGNFLCFFHAACVILSFFRSCFSRLTQEPHFKILWLCQLWMDCDAIQLKFEDKVMCSNHTLLSLKFVLIFSK